MNTNLGEALVLGTVIKRRAEDFEHTEVVIAPPFVWLASLKETLSPIPKNFNLAAQNCWWKDKGAFTGEISPEMLKDLVKYIIIGHSERRRIFKEDNLLIVDKLKAILHNNLIPIVCVGEMTDQSGDKIDKNIIIQVRIILDAITKSQLKNIIFAYEPLWAVGTGKAASPRYVAKVVDKIREEVLNRFDQESAKEVRILYGGSVTSSNISQYLSFNTVDGALVGGASLEGKEFNKICAQASEVN